MHGSHDARRLARAMSQKCALARLPVGGAKTVLWEVFERHWRRKVSKDAKLEDLRSRFDSIANEVLNEALAARREVLGNHHQSTLISICSLGSLVFSALFKKFKSHFFYF